MVGGIRKRKVINIPKKGERVYLRKDGLWEARYVKEIDAFGKKKYGSVYAHTCREVKEKRREKEDNIRLFQKPTVTSNITVTMLAEEWLYLTQNRIKLSTYQRYESFIKNHLTALSKQPVLYITTATLHEFAMDRLGYGLKPQSVNSILVFLHTCLKYGNKQYKLPIPEIVYLTPQKKEIRVFSSEEQKRLVSYLYEDMDLYKFGVLLALYTGLRIGELCALKWDDIYDDRIKIRRTVQRLRKADGSGTELHVSAPKTGASVREIPVPSFLSELIETYRKRSCSEYILGTDTIPISEPRVMQNKFQKYMSDLGIEGATFHSTRHSFASRCVECGVESKVLSELMGHSSISITLQRYFHPSFEFKRNSLEKLTKCL